MSDPGTRTILNALRTIAEEHDVHASACRAAIERINELRLERRKLAETLRAVVSDSDLADWVLEITDEQ